MLKELLEINRVICQSYKKVVEQVMGISNALRFAFTFYHSHPQVKTLLSVELATLCWDAYVSAEGMVIIEKANADGRDGQCPGSLPSKKSEPIKQEASWGNQLEQRFSWGLSGEGCTPFNFETEFDVSRNNGDSEHRSCSSSSRWEFFFNLRILNEY